VLEVVSLALDRLGVGGEPGRDEGVVGGQEVDERPSSEALVALCACRVAGLVRLGEQGLHLVRPSLVPAHARSREVAQHVGQADGVGSVGVGEVHHEPVVHHRAGETSEHARFVGGSLGASVARAEGRVELGRAQVEPRAIGAHLSGVSSTWTTGEATRRSATSAMKGSSAPAASCAREATKPVETGARSSSESAWAVRLTEQCWAWSR